MASLLMMLVIVALKTALDFLIRSYDTPFIDESDTKPVGPQYDKTLSILLAHFEQAVDLITSPSERIDLLESDEEKFSCGIVACIAAFSHTRHYALQPRQGFERIFFRT